MGATCIYFSGVHLVTAKPSVTIHILHNQRPSSNKLFGTEVEFYLRNNLQQTGLVDLTSFEITRQQPTPPVLHHNYTLTGEYQQVGTFIYLSVQLRKPDQTQVQFQQTFSNRQTLNHLKECGQWLLSALEVQGDWPNWSLQPEQAVLLYQLRLRRYQSDQLASVKEARKLFRSFGGVQSEAVMAEVSLQVLLTAQANIIKGGSLLKRIDHYLRKALNLYPKSSPLLAILSLNYYLSHSYPQFVEKTALKALSIEPKNDLALILAAISVGFSTGKGKEQLQKFKSIHPLAWKGKLDYLSGALKIELKKAATILDQLNHPDPYQLQIP